MGETQNQPFQLSFNASLKIDFQGSRVTSDGGLIPARGLDERLGLGELVEQNLTDSRRGKSTEFPVPELLRRSVYSRLAGYLAEKQGHNLFRVGIWKVVYPLLFYFTSFAALTWPLLLRFNTHLMGAMGDDLYNLWNLWWVNKAVMQLHQSPWHTQNLHWPYGVSLLGDTLTPFNGFLAIPLHWFLSSFQVYNSILVFTFVFTGYTTFLLGRHLKLSCWPSLLAGFVFTFSNYRFAHAQGHLNLVSTEWLPLFILLWLKLLSKPNKLIASGAAVTLFLVFLCEYNYVFFCFLSAVIIFIWRAMRDDDAPFFLNRDYWAPLGVFTLVSLFTCGMLVASVVSVNHHDPFMGAHGYEDSLDLFSPFIYGAFWKWSGFTREYWSQLSGGIHETSVHVGLSVTTLLIYVWRRRRDAGIPELGLLYFLALFFTLVSLGPMLHVWGKRFPLPGTPYAWMEAVFPLLRLSGVPVRFFVMAILYAALIAGVGFELLLRGSSRNRVWAVVLMAVLIPEYVPKNIPCIQVPVPDYIWMLSKLPAGGVLDTVSTDRVALYYQTIYDKPMAFGLVSRVPQSVDAADRTLQDTIRHSKVDIIASSYQIRYLIADERLTQSLQNYPAARILWSDGHIALADLQGLAHRAGP